jgi:hypothetical protein
LLWFSVIGHEAAKPIGHPLADFAPVSHIVHQPGIPRRDPPELCRRQTTLPQETLYMMIDMHFFLSESNRTKTEHN